MNAKGKMWWPSCYLDFYDNWAVEQIPPLHPTALPTQIPCLHTNIILGDIPVFEER